MNEDNSPIAVPGFLSSEVYGSIYMAVEDAISQNLENGNDPFAEPFVSKEPFVAYLDGFDEEVYGSIQENVKGCFDYDIKKPEIMFVRLIKNAGSGNTLPKFDSLSRENETTLVAILDSTIPWKLYLDGLYSYTERNMGIFFPSTDGVTWDVPEEFSELDYMDILVCRMSAIA